MAERVHTAGGVDPRLVAGGKHDARGPDRDEYVACGNDPRRHAAGGLIAGSRGHGQACGQAQRFRRRGGQCAGPRGRLNDAGQPVQRDRQVASHGLRPLTVGHVEESGARGIRDVGGGLAGEAQANEVLGQQNPANPSVGVGLVLAHPKELGRSESFQRWIGRARDDLGKPDLALDGLALGGGALVAPENGRPDGPIAGVQERGAMHLAGEPDSADDRRVRRHPDAGAEGLEGRAFPGVGVLLGPAGLRGVHGIFRRVGGQDASVASDQHRPRAGGAEVQAQQQSVAHRGVRMGGGMSAALGHQAVTPPSTTRS